MKFKELYNKVRREQEVSLDEASMWDAIESRLEKPKKKRRFIWLWFGMGLFVIGGYLFLSHGSESPYSQSEISKKISPKRANPVNTLSVLTPSKLDNNTLKTNGDGESILVDNPSTLIEEKLSVSPQKYNTVDIANSKIGAGRINLDEKYDNDTNPTENSNRSNDEKSLIAMNGSYENYSSTNNEIKATDFIGIIAPQNNNPKSEDKNSNTKKDVLDRSNNKNGLGLRLTTAALPMLSISNVVSESNKMKFNPMLTVLQNLASTDLPVAAEAIKQRKLELAFSLDYLHQHSHIEEKDPAVVTWGALHDQSKSSVSSFQLAAILTYRFDSGLGIGTGISTRHISEWYDTTVELVTQTELQSDSAKYTTINGIQQFASGILTKTRIDRTNYHTPIRRFYFDIPLEVSYSRSWNKWDGELSLTYNINLSHQYFGRSYAENQILLDQDQLRSEGVYNTNFVNSANIGLKINRHLSSSLSIGFSLNHWRQLSSSTSTTSSINENYRGLGGGLNIKKTFGQ